MSLDVRDDGAGFDAGEPRAASDTDSDVLPAIKAGATGYLLKDTPREELFRAAAHRGESVLSPAVAGRLMGRLRSPGQEPLSQRELEVLTLTARGCTNRVDRLATVHLRGDGQEPPASRVRETGRPGPGRGRGGRVRARPAR